MNVYVKKMWIYSKDKYWQYKYEHTIKNIIVLMIAVIITIVLCIIMGVFGFIDGLLASMRPSPEELEERERLRTIAREHSAASYGDNVGRQKFYDRRRELRQQEKEMSPLERLFR